MRAEILLHFFSRFHWLVALLFLVPLFVGIGFDEPLGWDRALLWAYLGPAIGIAAIGALLANLTRRRLTEPPTDLRRREGLLLVALSWFLIVLYGSLPYLISREIPAFADALFESTSGFTTTGATILEDIEALPYSLLFWRAFTHWLGGMGIIVLSVAILPELAVGGMQLFSTESTGIGVEKLAPRIAETAKRLWVLYAILTLFEILLLILGDMSVFDSITHAFATTATGGFSVKNASVGHYNSVYIETVIMIFMFLAGTNFALQYRVFVRGQLRKLLFSSEMRLYFSILVAVTGLVTLDLWLNAAALDGKFASPAQALRSSVFQVVSILTTTGFGTDDFNQWPTFSKTLIVAMMAIGGCAGSTAGGLKVIRLVVVFKHTAREFQRIIYPRLVKPITVDGNAIPEEILWSILGFFVLSVMVLLGSTVLLCTLSHQGQMDLVTATTASLSALNSIGPGLGAVGPVENFAFVHPLGKLGLSFCMLLGRLEIYTLLIVFLPSFWGRGR